MKFVNNCQDGRVGLRRQFQVLVRKGMGSNPILDIDTLFWPSKISDLANKFKLNPNPTLSSEFRLRSISFLRFGLLTFQTSYYLDLCTKKRL